MNEKFSNYKKSDTAAIFESITTLNRNDIKSNQTKTIDLL